MRRWWICLMAGLVACGGDDGENSGGKCAAPTGDYTLTFWPISGDCGTLNAVVAPEGEVPITGCADGSETWSDDGCTAEYFGRCPANDPYAEIELEVTVRWETDASEASGEATARAYDENGDLACTGQYQIRISPYES